jgi:P-loop Domain of unknown function (DUF2791)
MNSIRPRERDAVIQSLRAGVVPRIGQHLIQVGRLKEIEALLRDIERCADAGSAIRFVIAEYGAGKTFLLSLCRSLALEKRMVTVHADLSPDRRLQSTGGQARSLYSELMRNLATRSKPEGGAMNSVVERFVSEGLRFADENGCSPVAAIQARLHDLSEMTGGYDFAQVIEAYWQGHDTGNDDLKSNAVRWLRAEFATKTEARAALGVRTIIEDASFYDHLKLMARFVRHAGFQGLFVVLDEMVNLYKLTNPQARNANYEQILRILNDCLQGQACGLGLLMGGTPEFLMDTRRGLYSYQALQSRLAENGFARGSLVDYTSPVLRLSSLTPEDLYVLLTKIRGVFASGDPSRYLIPEEGLHAFLEHCARRIGESYFRTPRTTITAFVNLLAVLEQNPDVSWQELLGKIEVENEAGVAMNTAPGSESELSREEDELASLRL